MFSYLTGGYKEDGESLFARNHMKRQGVMGTNYSWRDTSWMQGKFFSMKPISHWSNLLREVGHFPMLDTFKVQLSRVLGSLV